MKEIPMSFDQIQTVQGAWLDVVKPEQSLLDASNYFFGEVEELREALDVGKREEILSECADVITCALEMVRILGSDPETILTKKWERNLNKYSIPRHEELVGQGFSNPEAVTIQRQEWDRTRDAEYYP